MLLCELLLLFLICQIVQASIRVDPLVKTQVGLIRGLRADDGDYSMFLGVPYAKVDDTNPFGPSIPYQKFETEFYADDDTTKCPHLKESGEIVGILDCLHLNIYVPESSNFQNLLPVMVWIYGGNFERGSAGRSLYGPKFIVRHDVILVTMNHRIGLYGYMCLDIPEVPGNQGLKDQVLALRWIRDNIESFSGEVNKITIFGESTGGRSVDFHILSPQEKLFNSAILQSGTSLNRNTIYDADTDAPIKIAERLGYPVNSVYEALDYLSTIEPHLAIATATELGLVIKPCVEKDFPNVEKFITDYTINLDVPKVKNVPILLGYNDDEQIARFADKEPEFFDDLNIFHDNLYEYFDFEEQQLKNAEELIRNFYIGDEKISEEMLFQIVNFDSVFAYNHPTERTMDKYKHNEASNIFYYVFSYVGNRNFYKQERNVTVGGASHADELGYLFDMQSILKDEPNFEDQIVLDRMTTLWTNFARFGHPTPEVTELLPVKWEPITEDIKFYMNIGAELKLGRRPFHMDTTFWDLFFKTYGHHQKGFKGNSK